ncbi:phage holin family protein [Flavobacterium aquiphilum]|uniref:phage holin family protein n=1 Tax=Flavobacterium aquiphilum TaxID=3003261 RepID=UPI0024807E9D|nr:phage holin family protein [Flavobacterium aquiphilum]
MEKIIVILWITFALYLSVLLGIFADLWSGIRKAKINGVARSSYGYRRTIDKIARYYNVLMALTVIDGMQISSVWYLDTYYHMTSLPMFPFLTLVGSIFMCVIEVKSILEKAEDKVRIENVGALAGKIITHKDDIGEIVKAVVEYMNKPEEKEVVVEPVEK